VTDHEVMQAIPTTIRLSLAAADDHALDTLIARLSAGFPSGTEVTVARGTVFNRHGMPPTAAALLCAAPGG